VYSRCRIHFDIRSWRGQGELKKRLKKNNISGRIVGVETIDKMTDHQIAAKVRQHFAE